MTILKIIIALTFGILGASLVLHYGRYFEVNEMGVVKPYLQEYLLVGGLLAFSLIVGIKRKISSGLALVLSLITISAFLVSFQLGWQLKHGDVWSTAKDTKLIHIPDWKIPTWIMANLISNTILFLTGIWAITRIRRGGILWATGISWAGIYFLREVLSWFRGAIFILIPIFIISIVLWLISHANIGQE